MSFMQGIADDLITLGVAAFVLLLFYTIISRLMGGGLGAKLKEWLGWE